jgi:NDP-sugar pyrophosphorylase family protein
MLPRTEAVPKTLLQVLGRPFASWQLDLLRAEGVDRVLYCLAHLGHQVEGYVRDGDSWGMSVTYSYERDSLLGTGGALRLASDLGLLDDVFFVLYGDSYLPTSYSSVKSQFEGSSGNPLMTVYRNAHRWGRSNVCLENGLVSLYDTAGDGGVCEYIDYGLNVLTREIVQAEIPAHEHFDLSHLFERLSLSGRLNGYQVFERFFEIGSPRGLQDLESYLRG